MQGVPSSMAEWYVGNNRVASNLKPYSRGGAAFNMTLAAGVRQTFLKEEGSTTA